MGAPRDSTALFWPREDQAFKNKVCKTEDQDKAPARGACRAKEARPRQEELAGTTEPKASRPRQEELAGKAVPGSRLHHNRHASALCAPRGARRATSFRTRQVPGPGK